MQTAIVTGTAGFIGSTLSEKLLEKNFKVIGIDNFSDYYDFDIKNNSLKQCLVHENFSFINEDILNIDLKPIFNDASYVFHESGQPGVRESWGNSFHNYVHDNIMVTQKLLEISKSCDSIKKIVIASSSSVYGNQNGKMNEEKSLTQPLSPYGVTKLASENLALLYQKNYNLPISALRYFSVYGPRQRPDMAFCKFFNSILNKKNISVFGDGTQERDFTFIDDIVSATILAAENDCGDSAINIGGGHVISVKDVIKIMEDIVNSEISVSYDEKQLGDVKRTEADISKASKLLNYKPTTDIQTGLEKQFQYMQENLPLYSNLLNS